MAPGVVTARSGKAVGVDSAVHLPLAGRSGQARIEAEPVSLSARRFPLSGIPVSVTVETAAGPRPLGDVTPGMLVRTLASGWQRVVAAVTIRHDLSRGDATPVFVRGGALGQGPGRDVNVPATQRIVIDSPRAVQVTGGRQVAVAVAHLGHLSDVRPLALASAVFVHVLLDGVDAVLADGLWFETFRPCPSSLAALGPEGCRALASAAPRVVHEAGQAQYVAPWRALSAREAEEVI